MRSFTNAVLGIVAVALLPAVVAALPTDILGNSPLLKMSDADKKLQYDAVLYVLESSDVHAVREWQNKKTGFKGRVDAQGDMTSADGLRCRRLQLRTEVNGSQSLFAFPFCKDAQGQWFIASGMKFSDPSDQR
jgi:surface antigen